MAVSKTLIALFAVLAVVTCEEPAKDKRQIFGAAYPYASHAAYAAPVAYAARPAYVAPAAYAAPAVAYSAPAVAYAAHGYDDGKYYPGKYESAAPVVHYG